jgi:GAF domain-containing protein/AmiR/NasT family two-component response regulator
MNRAIVIESEGIHRESLAGLLRNEGFDVAEAVDGQRGITAVRGGHEPALIFLADNLPGLPGIDALIGIRKFAPRTPVIMVMASENRQNAQMALSRGASWFIQKPIRPEEVLVVVRNIMDKSKLEQTIENQMERLTILEKQTSEFTAAETDELPTDEVIADDEFLKKSVDLVADVLEAKKISIMILERDGKDLVMAHSNWMLPSNMAKIRQPLGSGVAGEVVRSGKPRLVQDVNTDPKVDANEYSRQYESRSFICTPLFHGGKAIGAISANDKNDKTTFTRGDLAMLNTFAHQMSMAITNKFAMKKTEREKMKLTFVNESVNAILASVEPDEIFNSFLGKVCAGLSAEACALLIADTKEGKLTVEAVHPKTLTWGDEEAFGAGKGVLASVLSSGEVAILNKVQGDERVDSSADIPRGINVRNMAAAALAMKDKVLGLLVAYNKRDQQPFAQWDYELISAITPPASMAIKQAWLYQNLIKSIDEVVETNKQLELANRDIREKIEELNRLKKGVTQ